MEMYNEKINELRDEYKWMNEIPYLFGSYQMLPKT